MEEATGEIWEARKDLPYGVGVVTGDIPGVTRYEKSSDVIIHERDSVVIFWREEDGDNITIAIPSYMDKGGVLECSAELSHDAMSDVPSKYVREIKDLGSFLREK